MKHRRAVPGTELLTRGADSESANGHLKHDMGNIILVPQPSDDHNDPLNWPRWKKDLRLAIMGIGSILFAATVVHSPFPALFLPFFPNDLGSTACSWDS